MEMRERILARLRGFDLCQNGGIDGLLDAILAELEHPTPAMIAAAWAVFNRHPRDKMTPGPGFIEALQAMVRSARKSAAAQTEGQTHD